MVGRYADNENMWEFLISLKDKEDNKGK